LIAIGPAVCYETYGLTMRILLARYRSRSEFLERYDSTLPGGGIFLPTRKLCEAGEEVLVDVRMPELRDHALLRGLVKARQRGRRREGLRAGLTIEFFPDEHGKREHLLALARGDLAPEVARRRYRRLPIELSVDWRVPHQPDRHASRVEDIGTGGAFLSTPAPPAAGTSVVLELSPPGSGAAHIIEGRVAWTRCVPGREGAGVEFRCRDVGGMRRLRELVRRLERQAAA
jgi:Tfp pilus assembly protein PilZ